MAKRRKGAAAANGNADPLHSFLACVDKYVATISAQATAVAPEGEQRLVMQATGESIVAQTQKLTNYFRVSAAALAPAQRHELDQFLQVQDGEAAVDRALQVSAKILAPGAAPASMSFLNFLDEILHFLKKILEELFPDLPSWIQTILLIIDELMNLLKTLLGGLFGLRMSQVADELSRGEVNFLRELTALAELKAVQSKRRTADEESSN
jgi:hypothetical protein